MTKSMTSPVPSQPVDPAARKAYHDELRAIVADPARHKDYLMRSSMIQSLRELESVE